MKYILGFGDSWPFGSELQDNRKTFIELLAERKNIEWKNFAQPSTSIPHLILQLQQAITWAKDNNIHFQDTTAVFFLTSPHRDVIWSTDNQSIEVHLNPNHPEDKDWYTTVHTTHLVNFRVNTSLIVLQSMCKFYNITDRYIWGWESVPLWEEVDCTKIHDKFVIEYFLESDYQKKIAPGEQPITYLANTCNPYIWPNHGHPNQSGHEKIAEVLDNWIDI